MPSAAQKTQPKRIGSRADALFATVNPFAHVAQDEPLNFQRRNFDMVLFFFLLCGFVGFAVIEGMAAFDSRSYKSVCYETKGGGPDGDDLRIKHLCFTPERNEFKSFALMTFTCRGTHGGTVWAAPMHGGTGNSNQIVMPETQPDFCAQVITHPETKLLSFISKNTHDNCQGPGCDSRVDTSKQWTIVGQHGTQYYRRGPGETQDNGFVCCGMRLLQTPERIFVWLAALGGAFITLRNSLRLIPFCERCRYKGAVVEDQPGTSLQSQPAAGGAASLGAGVLGAAAGAGAAAMTV
jgi:hypothetical protein